MPPDPRSGRSRIPGTGESAASIVFYRVKDREFVEVGRLPVALPAGEVVELRW